MPGVRSVAFGAWVRAASLHEPRERMGVSHLLEHMVFKGTERRTAHEIALVARGARRLARRLHVARAHRLSGARARRASARGRRRDRRHRLPAAAARDAISTLERKVILEEIGMVEDTPDDLVFELHNEALWGAHPYGYSILGTRDTVQRARRARPAGAARARVPSGAARRRRVGQRRARAAARRARARRDGSSAPRGDATPLVPPPPRAAPPSATSRRARGRADAHRRRHRRASRTAIRARFPLLLLSMLLGGGMSSRLFQRVREELGLAYSVFTYQ